MITQRIKIQDTTIDEPVLQVVMTSIQNGRIISAPTETFYVLCADPFNLRVVEEIFLITKRQEWKPLLLLVDSLEQVEGITTSLPDTFYEIAEQFWPGPLTLILPAANCVPLKITGGTGTVGVRIPDSKIVRTLLRALDSPLTGTSANLSTHSVCSTADDVLIQLGGKIDSVLDQGDTRGRAPSTILDLTRDPFRIVREGAIPVQKLSPYLSP
ncbi:MAG: L-threonylcarbamoyladenylate synthase [Terriglobia bacterium]